MMWLAAQLEMQETRSSLATLTSEKERLERENSALAATVELLGKRLSQLAEERAASFGLATEIAAALRALNTEAELKVERARVRFNAGDTLAGRTYARGQAYLAKLQAISLQLMDLRILSGNEPDLRGLVMKRVSSSLSSTNQEKPRARCCGAFQVEYPKR